MKTRRPQADTKTASQLRMILGSAAAGVGVMVFAGLIAPTIISGGLSLRTANAATFEQPPQLIEPLDLKAIGAQLDHAQADMEAAREKTDPMVNRLQGLSHE